VVADGALMQANVSAAPAQVSLVTTTPCDTTTEPGFCLQRHTVDMSSDPCSVEAFEMVMHVQLRCAVTEDDPSTCGFRASTLPAGNVFTLANLMLTYDSCPVELAFTVDATKSWVRLFEDDSRTTPLQQVDQDDTVRVRVSLEPSEGATFQSVELQEMRLFRVDSPAALDLGDLLLSPLMQRVNSSSFVSEQQAVFDLDLLVDRQFFQLTYSYYMQASLDVVFVETGQLRRKRQTVTLRRLQTQESSSETLFSRSFKPSRSTSDDGTHVQASSSAQLAFPIMMAALGGACVTVLLLILLVGLKWRRERKEEELEEMSDDVIVF